MTKKTKNTLLKMCILIALLMFACNSGSRQNQTNSQAELMFPMMTSDTIHEINIDTEVICEANNDEATETDSKIVSENNTGNRSGWAGWMPFTLVDVQPLFNGKPWEGEYNAYVRENHNLLKLSEEAGIKEKWFIFFMFFIDKDGTVVDVSTSFLGEGGRVLEEKEENSSYQLLAIEMKRVINSTQGKWTPAIHDNEKMKVRIAGSLSL